MPMSSPERAILEMLDELPKGKSFHKVDVVFESLANLRPRLLTTLLAQCRSVKTKRLFFVYAERLHPTYRLRRPRMAREQYTRQVDLWYEPFPTSPDTRRLR